MVMEVSDSDLQLNAVTEKEFELPELIPGSTIKDDTQGRMWEIGSHPGRDQTSLDVRRRLKPCRRGVAASELKGTYEERCTNTVWYKRIARFAGFCQAHA